MAIIPVIHIVMTIIIMTIMGQLNNYVNYGYYVNWFPSKTSFFLLKRILLARALLACYQRDVRIDLNYMAHLEIPVFSS